MAVAWAPPFKPRKIKFTSAEKKDAPYPKCFKLGIIVIFENCTKFK